MNPFKTSQLIGTIAISSVLILSLIGIMVSVERYVAKANQEIAKIDSVSFINTENLQPFLKISEPVKTDSIKQDTHKKRVLHKKKERESVKPKKTIEKQTAIKPDTQIINRPKTLRIDTTS
jgi:hypothetical protein